RDHRVLVHRDFQSSNVLLKRHKPVLIDFQGMRFGPAAYDLASLLCDPYVCLPEKFQHEMLRYYAELTGRSFESLWRIYWYAAVQRLVQALGAFARFETRAETREFGQYIGPGFAMLRLALRHVAGLPELARLAAEYGDS
ncbi:MAG: phosphotransferase, partial [Kiritimatiellae bacterium]|nr:phosphotransferase [Kiritimatiellia bacterium]